MNPLQPLIALLGQTERERDAAWAEAQRCTQAHEAAETQGRQLVEYRREYEQRFSAQFRREGGMEILHCYRDFMARLSQAIEHQQRATAQAAERVEQARVALREAELRVASVKKLIERREAELRRDAERREQRQTDEFAARAGWARQALPGIDVIRVA